MLCLVIHIFLLFFVFTFSRPPVRLRVLLPKRRKLHRPGWLPTLCVPLAPLQTPCASPFLAGRHPSSFVRLASTTLQSLDLLPTDCVHNLVFEETNWQRVNHGSEWIEGGKTYERRCGVLEGEYKL